MAAIVCVQWLASQWKMVDSALNMVGKWSARKLGYEIYYFLTVDMSTIYVYN